MMGNLNRFPTFIKFFDSKIVLFISRMSNLFRRIYEKRYFSSLYSRWYQFMAFPAMIGPCFLDGTEGIMTTSTPRSRYLSTYGFSEKNPTVKRNRFRSQYRTRLYMQECDPPRVPSFEVSQKNILFFKVIISIRSFSLAIQVNCQ